MKAYTLRMDDDILGELKTIGIKEKKSIRKLLMDLIASRISKDAEKSDNIVEQRRHSRVQKLLQRLPEEQVTRSIREMRNR